MYVYKSLPIHVQDYMSMTIHVWSQYMRNKGSIGGKGFMFILCFHCHYYIQVFYIEEKSIKRCERKKKHLLLLDE